MYTLYMHKNKINGKVYIGQTSQEVEKRWRKDGKGYASSARFYNAIKKYGWDNFEHIILKQVNTLEEANLLEEELIATYNSMDEEFGYNMQAGGKNHSITDETKEKISKTKLSQHLHMSEEQKQKMSLMNKGENNPFYGKHHTEETRKKMSKNHADVKGGKNPCAKKVLCIETGEIFDYAGDAAKSVGRSKSAITNCCSGRSHSAGSFHWRYIEDDEIPREST